MRPSKYGDFTVKVHCKPCGAVLAFVEVFRRPEGTPAWMADHGPTLNWSEISTERVVAERESYHPSDPKGPPELASERREVWAWRALDEFDEPTVRAWCRTHGYVTVPLSGVRARHHAVMRSDNRKTSKWRLTPGSAS